MNIPEVQKQLLGYVSASYPNMQIDIIESEGKTHIYFTDEKFKDLYPRQRYHYLSHLIPSDFYNSFLSHTIWYELAPHEKPEELDYHNDETINSIKDLILKILKEKTHFIQQLDHQFTIGAVCHGDYRHAKLLLEKSKFTEPEQFDIFHVLMSEGGYCDCEILYNVFKDSQYARQYWLKRSQQQDDK